MSEKNTERPKPQEYHRIMRIVSEWGCHCSHDGPCDMNCDFGVIENCTKTLAARIAELEAENAELAGQFAAAIDSHKRDTLAFEAELKRIPITREATLTARIAELELKYNPAFALNTEMADRIAELEAEIAELREVKEVCDYIKTNHPGHYKAALMSICRSNKAALAARDQQKGGA